MTSILYIQSLMLFTMRKSLKTFYVAKNRHVFSGGILKI